eukprot:g8204.t1
MLKLIMVLVLVPTKELCLQILMEFRDLLKSFSSNLKVCSFTSTASAAKESGHLVVSTPRVISSLLQKKSTSFTLDSLSILVVDEADLILSYGYNVDIKFISPRLPRGCQCMMTSATESPELDSVVKLTLERPLRINLLNKTELLNLEFVSHRYLICLDEDRFVHLLVFIHFQCLPRPILVFVNTIRKGYVISIFLKRFGIKNCHLHAELPVNLRNRMIQDFNRGRFEVLVVMDDMEAKLEETETKTTRKEKEFGASRGLDFKKVGAVINFDLPLTLNGYIHRVGRTGRAENSGIALSFFPNKSIPFYAELAEHLNGSHLSEAIFTQFQDYNTEHVDGLKYRATDVINSISKNAINEARLEDLKTELLKSTELSQYFVSRPLERAMLDTIGKKNRRQESKDIANLPTYITGGDDHDPDQDQKSRKKLHRKLRKDPLEDKAWGSLPEEAYVYRRYQYMEAEVEYLRDMELELRGRLRQSQSENSALSSELNRMKESWKDALVAKRKAEEAFADQTETISRLRIAYGRKVDEVRKLQLQLAEDRREWMASIQKLQNEVESQSKERRKKETNQSDTDSGTDQVYLYRQESLRLRVCVLDISLNEFIGSCASPCSNYEPGILSSSRNNSPVVSPRTLHDLRAENKRLNEENKRLKADHDQVQKTQQAYDRRQKLDALKQEGNNHFQRGEYQEALNCYSQAINFAEDDPRMQAVLHSNKAAILINFEKNLDAIVSCCCAVSADSSYLRAFQRRANAYESLGDISAALQDLQWIINSDCESSSLYHEAQVKIMELQSRYKRSQKADPYKVLGLCVSAGTAEVKSQFRKLALQFHPDKTSNQEGSAEVFKLISQANSILSDEIKRRRFDSVRLNSSRIDQTKRV